MKIGRPVIAALAAVLALSLGACSSGSSSGSSSDGGKDGRDGKIVFGMTVGPSTMDPGSINSIHEALYLMPVYDRLVYLDPSTRKANPMLATKWELGSDEKGSYVDFTLREGLKFPDGAPFNAATVVANIDRSKSLVGSGIAADLANVTGAEAISETVARVRGSGGAAWIVNVMGGRAGMMISQNALTNTDLATKPVGIGMWTLESFDPSKVTYTKTPNYWDPDAQKSEKLEIDFIPDDTARFNALRSGGIDFTVIRASQVETAKSAGIKFFATTGGTTIVFLYNTSVKGLENQQVREALQKAIDRKAISDQLLGGYCEPTDQVWSPGHQWSDPDLKMVKYDPKAAKQEIADAGFADSLSFVVGTPDVDQYKKIAEILQAQFADVGVKVELKSYPATASRQMFATDHAVDIANVTLGLEADPSLLVSQYLLENGTYNPGKHANTKIAQLAEEASDIGDSGERAKAYRQISKLAVEDANYLTICAPKLLWGLTNGLSGFDGGMAGGLIEFRGVVG